MKRVRLSVKGIRQLYHGRLPRNTNNAYGWIVRCRRKRSGHQTLKIQHDSGSFCDYGVSFWEEVQEDVEHGEGI